MRFANTVAQSNIARWAARLTLGWLLSYAYSVFAIAPDIVERQDLVQIKNKIEEFLITQSAGYPGKVTISAGSIDPHIKLKSCAALEIFLPTGSRAWGKTSVGVRCNAPNVWVIYVQAQVTVYAQYVVAALPLTQGHTVSQSDILLQEGDVTHLPVGIFTEASQAVGRTVAMSMVAGSVLRQEMLKVVPVVQQGQTVLLTSLGKGFSVTAEGIALNNAIEGKLVQVKVQSGQVVTGIARTGGKVEIGF